VYMRNGYKSACISEEAVSLMNRSKDKLIEAGADLIIGGCTEVSLGIKQEYMDVQYVDTLDLLARKTVDYCYNTDVTKNYKSNSI
jgi:aspartate racemase